MVVASFACARIGAVLYLLMPMFLANCPAVPGAVVVRYTDTGLGERAFAQPRPRPMFDIAVMQEHMASRKVAKQFWPECLEMVE